MVLYNLSARVILFKGKPDYVIPLSYRSTFPSHAQPKLKSLNACTSNHLAPLHPSEPVSYYWLSTVWSSPSPQETSASSGQGFYLVCCYIPHSPQARPFLTHLPSYCTPRTKNNVWYMTGFAKWLTRFGNRVWRTWDTQNWQTTLNGKTRSIRPDYRANTSSLLDGPAYDAISTQPGTLYRERLLLHGNCCYSESIPSEPSLVRRSPSPVTTSHLTGYEKQHFFAMIAILIILTIYLNSKMV